MKKNNNKKKTVAFIMAMSMVLTPMSTVYAKNLEVNREAGIENTESIKLSGNQTVDKIIDYTEDEMKEMLEIINADPMKRLVILYSDYNYFDEQYFLDEKGEIKEISLNLLKSIIHRQYITLTLKGGWYYELYDNDIIYDEIKMKNMYNVNKKEAEILNKYGIRNIKDWSWLNKIFNKHSINLKLKNFTETDYKVIKKNGFLENIKNRIEDINVYGYSRLFIKNSGSDIDIDFNELFPKNIFTEKEDDYRNTKVQFDMVGGRWPVDIDYDINKDNKEQFKEIVAKDKLFKDIDNEDSEGEIFEFKLESAEFKYLVVLDTGKYLKLDDYIPSNDDFEFYNYYVKGNEVAEEGTPIALYKLDRDNYDEVKYKLDEETEIEIIGKNGEVYKSNIKANINKLKGRDFIWGGPRNMDDSDINAWGSMKEYKRDLNVDMDSTMWNLHLFFGTNEVAVNLDANGGKFEDDSKIKQTNVIKDEKIIEKDLETPSRKGYIFKGWTIDEEGNELFDFDKIINSPTTIYAKWQIDSTSPEIILDKEVIELKEGNKEDLNKIFKDNIKEIKDDYDKNLKDKVEIKVYKDGVEIKDLTDLELGNYEVKYTVENSHGKVTEKTIEFKLVEDKTEKESLTDTVILANGYKFTDVLTSTVLGNEKKAPILLTNTENIKEDTMKEIERLNPKEIIISGGNASVSSDIEKELKDKNYEVNRVSGKDRYETAKVVGEEVREITKVNDKVILADGTNFPDVITMSTLASQNHTPILLTEPSQLENTTDKTIKDWKVKDITIGGGNGSVSENIEKELKKDKKVSRIGGVDRYETASLVAKEVVGITGNKTDSILVNGMDFPDGITINSMAGKLNAPIYLTNPKELPEITRKDMKDVKNVLIGGGENSVSNNIEEELSKDKKVNRVQGKDRFETAVKISERFTEK